MTGTLSRTRCATHGWRLWRLSWTHAGMTFSALFCGGCDR